MVLVEISAPVMETEKEEKVFRALENLFPGIKFRREGDLIVGKCGESGLLVLKEKVWSQRILDTVREELLRNYSPEKKESFIHLSKQAAFAGKVSVVDEPSEEELGTIKVVFRGEDVLRFIDKFSPPTRDGKPIF